MKKIEKTLADLATPQKASRIKSFFKTSPGDYAEKDIFMGVYVPELRAVAQENKELSLSNIQTLLQSPINEKRLLALLIMALQYDEASPAKKEDLYTFYLKNRSCVNNWNLVDLSAPAIAGKHLLKREKSILKKLIKDPSLWNRRIGIVSTLAFVKAGELDWSLKLAKGLLKDEHDLMHKATGWVLREVGKKDLGALRSFLRDNAHTMPRTMLRYSIERMEVAERKIWLAKKKPN